MSANAENSRSQPIPTGSTDFFISYSTEDVEWARWITWCLRNLGYSTISMLDFTGGNSFREKMREACRDARRIVPLYSPDLWESSECRSEFDAFWDDFQQNQTERFILPLMVRECQAKVPGPNRGLVYVNLCGCDATSATNAIKDLVNGIDRCGNGKSLNPGEKMPAFPGAGADHSSFDFHAAAISTSIHRTPRKRKLRNTTILWGLVSSVGLLCLLLFALWIAGVSRRAPPTVPPSSRPVFARLSTLSVDQKLPPSDLPAIIEFQRTSLSTGEPNFEQLVLAIQLESGVRYQIALNDSIGFPPMLWLVASGNASVMSANSSSWADRLAVLQNHSAPVIIHVAPSAERSLQLVKCYLKFYYDPTQEPIPFANREVMVTRLGAVSGG